MGLTIECNGLEPKDQGEWLLNYFNKGEQADEEQIFEAKEDDKVES